jgi:hypothetical protein
MTPKTKTYTYSIRNNKVEIKKVQRTKTQYEYFLKIFIGQSDYESILIYQRMWLTKKNALAHAKDAIIDAKKPRLERVI